MEDLAADIRDPNRIRDFCFTLTNHAMQCVSFLSTNSCFVRFQYPSRRENRRMKELMSEPLEVNRYPTWLPPSPQRMARVVETSLRDDSRLPDSIYMMRRPAPAATMANNGTAGYGRASTPPPHWRGSLENLYEAPAPLRPRYTSYEPNHFRNYRRLCPPRFKTTRQNRFWGTSKVC